MNLKAWRNHALINFIDAIISIFYAIVPPEITGHSKVEIENLANIPLKDIFYTIKA